MKDKIKARLKLLDAVFEISFPDALKSGLYNLIADTKQFETDLIKAYEDMCKQNSVLIDRNFALAADNLEFIKGIEDD